MEPIPDRGKRGFNSHLDQRRAGGRHRGFDDAEWVHRFAGPCHDREKAVAARENFIARFSGGAMPEDIPEKTLDCGGQGIGIAAALTSVGLTSSNSEAFRMIKQGGVRIEGEKISDRSLQLQTGFTGILQVGKLKFCKAHVK